MNKHYDLKIEIVWGSLIFLEVFLFFFLFSFFSPFVTGEIGENATVITYLTIGTTFPEIMNISVDDGATSVTLNANSTKDIICAAVIRDYNNESDFSNVTTVFFDKTLSTYGAADDNNTHYTNNSCEQINDSSGWPAYSDDIYHYVVNCTFSLQYYTNPGNWDCNMTVTDKANLKDNNVDNITVNELLSVGLPTSINYGKVNSTYVSSEKVANVTNFGNVNLNLSLSGYALSEGDGYAMNCSLGSLPNISLMYEKFNLTQSDTSPLSLSAFEGQYTNLTNSSTVFKFDLPYRQDEGFNEAVNSTYWRIYVPKGVAGTCQGNIIFGAAKAAGI